eukprot:3509725-Pyramimonas_sp.AAC.1
MNQKLARGDEDGRLRLAADPKEKKGSAKKRKKDHTDEDNEGKSKKGRNNHNNKDSESPDSD